MEPMYSLSSLIEQILDLCSASDDDDQQTGGQRVERAAMADFFGSSFRRTIATTSCEVMPAALSTKRTPSRYVQELVASANGVENFGFGFGDGARTPPPAAMTWPPPPNWRQFLQTS